MVKKEDSPKMIRGKSIRINIEEEGVLEGNVIQIPFIAEYRHKNNPITNIDYEWNTTQDNVKIKRGLRISGHGRYGVPTLREKEVLRCLHNIFIAQKTENGVCELKHPDACKPNDYAISFTIESLCKEIGYKSPCNKTRDIVKKSLEILVATTIFNNHSGGIYDPEKKQYITNQNTAFHFLETLEQEEQFDDDGNLIRDITQIKLSEFVYKSLYNNYKLIYSKSKVNSIRHLGTKSLYQLAMQWSNKGVAYIKIDKLVEHIPMKDGVAMPEKRRYIKNCLDRLNKSGLVEVDISNTNVATFKFRDLMDKNKSDDIDSMYGTYQEILDGVMQLGFTKYKAQSFLDKTLANLPKAQLALRQTHALKMQDFKLDEKTTFLKLFSDEGYEQLML